MQWHNLNLLSLKKKETQKKLYHEFMLEQDVMLHSQVRQQKRVTAGSDKPFTGDTNLRQAAV